MIRSARLRSALAPLLITLAAAVATRVPAKGAARERPSAAPVRIAPPASEDAIALLGGLRPGQSLAGLEVRRVFGPVDRRLGVELAGSTMEVTLTVTLCGVDPHRAPRRSERYCVYHDAPRAPGRTADPRELEAILGALAERIARTEHLVPLPAGM